MIQVKLVSDDGSVLQLKTAGRIVPDGSQFEDEPLAKMFGAEVYSRRVLLNLEDSDYMDSSGIGWLLRCHKRFNEAGGLLVLHSTPKMIQQMLKLLQLDRILTIASDAGSARAVAMAEEKLA